MDKNELLSTQRRSKCKAWAQRRVDGSYGYRDSRELRTKLIENLSANLAEDLDLNIESVKESLEAHTPSFEFKYQYPAIQVDVANVLLSYLSGDDPFKRRLGKRAGNQIENYAALYAWLMTDNLSATAALFGKDSSTFKRDMGTFAKDIGVRLYDNEEDGTTSYQSKMAYFDELRNVGGNIAIMEASKKFFIDYMRDNHTQLWDQWIQANRKN